MTDGRTTSAPAPSTAAVVSDTRDGWREVLRDVFPRDPHGIFTVSAGLLRSPFETALRLAADRDYRNYWSHIVVLTGVTAIALYVTLPQVFNYLVGQDLVGVADAAQRLRLKMQVMQIAAFLLLTPLQYYACRLISPVPQAPRTYFKLCALSISFGLLLRIVLGILTVFAGLVIFHGRLNVGLATVIQTEFAIGTLLILAYVTELHRRFWGFALWKSLVLTIVFFLFTALVASPALLMAVQALDRLDWIGKLVK